MFKTQWLLSLLALTTDVFSQAPNVEWQRALGGTSGDYAYSTCIASDGGFVTCGRSRSNNGDVTGHTGSSSFDDFWVVKLSGIGALEWEVSLGGNLDDHAFSIQATTDGGFVVAGQSNSTDGDVTGNHGGIDCWVVKLDASGAMDWQKTLGGSGVDLARSIEQTDDGGYIVAGSSSSIDGDVTGNHGASDIWLVKLNEAGTVQWQKSLGGSGADGANSVRQTNDEGYIVAGASESNDGDVSGNHGGSDIWVVKTDLLGTIEWQKTLGGTGGTEPAEYASCIEQTIDGEYIVAGTTGSNNGDVSGNHGSLDGWVVKLDAQGDLQWQRALGGTGFDYCNFVKQTSEGGYILAGSTDSNDGDVAGNHGGTSDLWLVKLAEGGTLLWQKPLGGINDDKGFSVFETADEGFVVTGFSNSNDGDVSGSHGGYDYWVVKLGPDPNSIFEFGSDPLVQVFPNPTSGIVSINYTLKATAFVMFQLFAPSGQLVLTQPDVVRSAGTHTTDPFILDLPAGIYDLRVGLGDHAVSRKLVVL